MIMRSVGLVALLLLGSCGQGAPTNTQVIDNAIDTDLNVDDAADDRADHLDERAAELLDQANRSAGQRRAALQREATADSAAAIEVRQAGQADGARAEDDIEQNAGLLNSQGR